MRVATVFAALVLCALSVHVDAAVHAYNKEYFYSGMKLQNLQSVFSAELS